MANKPNYITYYEIDKSNGLSVEAESAAKMVLVNPEFAIQKGITSESYDEPWPLAAVNGKHWGLPFIYQPPCAPGDLPGMANASAAFVPDGGILKRLTFRSTTYEAAERIHLYFEEKGQDFPCFSPNVPLPR